MYRDNIVVFFSGKVISQLKRGKRTASFYCETEAPGGNMIILIKVAINDNFHLIAPEGSYIDVFGGEVYKTEREKNIDLAVYIRECSQINVCAPYKGEMNADELLNKKDEKER